MPREEKTSDAGRNTGATPSGKSGKGAGTRPGGVSGGKATGGTERPTKSNPKGKGSGGR